METHVQTKFNYNRKIVNELPFPDVLTLDLPHSIFRELCIDSQTYLNEPAIESFNTQLDQLIIQAFEKSDHASLLEVHKILYMIYESYFMNPISVATTQHEKVWFFNVKRKIEQAWLSLEVEEQRNRHDLVEVIDDPQKFREWIMTEANLQTDLDQRVVNYLSLEADRDQFRDFISIEANLNYRFYDALVLTLFHYSEEVKEELSHHLWDESGEGNREKAHTWLFSKALDYFELEYPHSPVWNDWRPYAGYNLYFLFGLNRPNYYKALGSLAMPELFDVNRDRYVVLGLEKFCPESREVFVYYYSHIEADEAHGPEWLDHIINPAIVNNSQAAMEVALGASIRMKYMRLFNLFLIDRFGIT